MDGRLELYAGGVWQGVCYEGFNAAAVNVACRSMGHPAGGSIIMPQPTIERSTFAGDFGCDGDELNFNQCGRLNPGSCRSVVQMSCNSGSAPPPTTPPTQPAPPPGSVTCERGDFTTDGFSLSLENPVSDAFKIIGRLAIDTPRGLGKVSSCSFTEEAANVACKQLGHHSGKLVSEPTDWSPPTSGGAGATMLGFTDSCKCNQMHNRLIECPHVSNTLPLGSDCRGADAAVFLECKKAREGDVRLKDRFDSGDHIGADEENGIVEFFNGTVWGTICNDGLNDNAGDIQLAKRAAQAICKGLCYDDGEFNNRPVSAAMAARSAPIRAENLNCPVGSTSFADCSYRTDHDCSLTEKISVICSKPDPNHNVAECTKTGGAGGESLTADTGGFPAIAIIIPVVVVIFVGIFLFLRSRKNGAAMLSATYERVQNRNLASPTDEDDDDDTLIIADGDVPVGGTMKLTRDTDYDLGDIQNTEENLYDRAGRGSENPYDTAASTTENDYSTARATDENDYDLAAGGLGGNGGVDDMWGAEATYDLAVDTSKNEPDYMLASE